MADAPAGDRRSRPFRRVAAAAALALVSAALYAVLLSPMPKNFFSGIPFGAFAWEALPRRLQPGDHLQLMYHFDLVRQFLSGEVAFPCNLWEFNLGDETVGRAFDFFYAPFSVPYALLCACGLPDAAAWNAVQFFSVFLGLAFCYALARRYGAGRIGAFAAAALATSVPYRWTMLANGSPTGFAMALVPAVALGADIAVRDRKLRGGILSGAALFACYASDLHCFLFAALAFPVWGLAALVRSADNPFAGIGRFLRLVLAVLPVAVSAVAALALRTVSGPDVEGTALAFGRSLDEISLNSPSLWALFDPFFECHAAESFYVGLPLVLAVSVAAATVFVRLDRELIFAARNSGSSRARAFPRPFSGSGAAISLAGCFLAFAVVGAFFFALGTNGPADAAVLRLMRAAFGPVRCVRQPVKVFCLLPALLAPLFAAAFLRSGRTAAFRGRAAAAVAAVALAAVGWESRTMYAGVCLLPGANGAWDAVAADAAARGADARALVLPIWPGDAAWSSVYQHLAVRSRVRMVNGYSPLATRAFNRDVCGFYSPMAQGGVSREQFDGLAGIGVTHVILQEKAFAPGSSPFPFAATLRRFFANPAFRFVGESDGSWAFALERDPPESAFVPAKLPGPMAEYPVPDVSAWKIKPPKSGFSAKLVVSPEACGPDSGWLVLARNDGPVSAVSIVRDETGAWHSVTSSLPRDLSAPENAARAMFVPSGIPGPDRKAYLDTEGAGSVAFAAWTSSGGVVESAPGAPDGVFRLNPGLFKHDTGLVAGVSPDNPVPTGISFRKGRDTPSHYAATGPGLPLALPPGRYEWRFAFSPEDAVPAPGADWPAAVYEIGGVSKSARPGGRASQVSGSFSYDGVSPVTFSVHWPGSEDCVLSAIDIRPATAAPGR